MTLQDHVKTWFAVWEEGNHRAIPVIDDFTHESPFGTVEGKRAYLDLVAANDEAFLGFRFEIHDEVHGPRSSAVRYTGHKGEFSLDVAEWFFGDENGISKISSYYNVGEASYDEME